jgi:trehalose 6-phosphate phosphatase
LIYAFSTAGLARLDALLATAPLLAFDIDGTLAPIAERPGDARLPDEVQRGLAEIAQRSAVAIITGRAVNDARRMLSFAPRYLIGNHGAEGLPGWRRRSDAFAATVRQWRPTFAADIALHQAGVSIEDKKYSMSLHFRRAADPTVARREIDRCIAALRPQPRIIAGKSVVNVLPPDAPDKGDALRTLIGAAKSKNVLYVGDDDTDEAVFALDLPGVLTLRVEPSETSVAKLFVHDQREVPKLIERIVRQTTVPPPSRACQAR